MATDVCLFTKRATKGTGASAVPGVCMITKSKVKWEPSDPSRAQPVVLDINAITRERGENCSSTRGSLPPSAAKGRHRRLLCRRSSPRLAPGSQARSRPRASLSSS